MSRTAIASCRRQREIVREFRRRDHTDNEYKSTKDDRWDPHRKVVACCSLVSPFRTEKRFNSATLRNGHPILQQAYSLKGLTIGVKLNKPQKMRLGQPAWEPGHCAEHHAAHALLNTMDKIGRPVKISEIRFGETFDIVDYKPEHYCNTCKEVFPQLR